MFNHVTRNGKSVHPALVPFWVIDRLTLTEMGMYMCIAAYVDKDRKASLTGSELSKDSDLSRRQVFRIIASLEAKGVIKCHKSAGQPNTYELPIQPFVQQDDAKVGS